MNATQGNEMKRLDMDPREALGVVHGGAQTTGRTTEPVPATGSTVGGKFCKADTPSSVFMAVLPGAPIRK